jgi:hypothetical protein
VSDDRPEFQDYMRGTSEGRHPWFRQEPQPIGQTYPPPEVAAAQERAEFEMGKTFEEEVHGGMIVIVAGMMGLVFAVVVVVVGLAVLLP